MVFLGHRSRKRFGQHWLIDPKVLDQILVEADLQPQDRVLEVGPGRGALTERLLNSPAAAVHAIELDRDLVDGLYKRFLFEKSRFTLQQGDVLSVSLIPPDGLASTKVVANIPYNITGPLLERLLGRLGKPGEISFRRLVLLLQKEVAERILAKPGQSHFSALSVRLQLMANCRKVCLVPPRCFQPPPKVTSEVISIEPFPSDKQIEPVLATHLDGLLRRAFMGRRKMLRNSLNGFCSHVVLESVAGSLGINLNKRPQELSPELWLAFSTGLVRAGQID